MAIAVLRVLIPTIAPAALRIRIATVLTSGKAGIRALGSSRSLASKTGDRRILGRLRTKVRQLILIIHFTEIGSDILIDRSGCIEIRLKIFLIRR